MNPMPAMMEQFMAIQMQEEGVNLAENLAAIVDEKEQELLQAIADLHQRLKAKQQQMEFAKEALLLQVEGPKIFEPTEERLANAQEVLDTMNPHIGIIEQKLSRSQVQLTAMNEQIVQATRELNILKHSIENSPTCFDKYSSMAARKILKTKIG